MNEVFFEDSPMRRMERYLDLSVQRQSLISSNLANLDTPGYKTADLNFEQELQGAVEGQGISLQVTNNRHLSNSLPPEGQTQGTVIEVEGLTLRNDLNNVNIDREMAELSTNALKFSTIAQLIAGKFRTLRNAILEGR